MLVSGVLSSEKRPSDARCGKCLLLDKKSLLSSEMSVKPLTVFRASILTYGVLARAASRVPHAYSFRELEDNQLVRTFETLLTLPPDVLDWKWESAAPIAGATAPLVARSCAWRF
jgi:hypothetical protein